MRTPAQKPLATLEVSVYGLEDYAYTYNSEHNARPEPVKSAVRHALDGIAQDFGEGLPQVKDRRAESGPDQVASAP